MTREDAIHTLSVYFWRALADAPITRAELEGACRAFLALEDSVWVEEHAGKPEPLEGPGKRTP